ncbi:MAG: hypothetical protein RR309_03355 [Cellulosilyticaceae bacterium]
MLIDRNQRQPNSPPTSPPPNYIPNENQAAKAGGSGGKSAGPKGSSSQGKSNHGGPGGQSGHGNSGGPGGQSGHGNSGGPGGPNGHGGPGGQPGASAKAVDPGAVFPCLYRYTYIWPNRGRGFWAYPTYIGRNSISGWKYDGRRWVYFGMDLRRIRSFYCY